MLSGNQKITMRQFQILMVLSAFGTGVIVLPRRVAEYADQDGWLVVVGLSLVALVAGTLITSAANMFPSATFMAYTRRLFSRPFAYIAGVGLLIKIGVSIGLQLHIFAEITRVTLLKNTPMPVVCLCMLAIGAYAAVKGIETRARVGELLFLAVMIPLLILFVMALFDIDFSNLQPAFVTPPSRIVSGTLGLGYIFTGLEWGLLVFPFLNEPQKGRRAVWQALGLISVLFLLITTVTMGKFGPEDLKHQTWPVLRMMDMLNIPGSFIERQDALVLSFWIICLFTTVNAALFYGAVLSKDIFRRGRHAHHVLLFAAAVLAIACLPMDASCAERLLDVLSVTLGVFYLFIFPLILLAAARLRGKKEDPICEPQEEALP